MSNNNNNNETNESKLDMLRGGIEEDVKINVSTLLGEDVTNIIFEYAISFQHTLILEDIYWVSLMRGDIGWQRRRSIIVELNYLRKFCGFKPVRVLPAIHKNYGQQKRKY